MKFLARIILAGLLVAGTQAAMAAQPTFICRHQSEATAVRVTQVARSSWLLQVIKPGTHHGACVAVMR